MDARTLARRAAQRLGAMHDQRFAEDLAASVEGALYAQEHPEADKPRHFALDPATTIALGALIVSMVPVALELYREFWKRPSPSSPTEVRNQVIVQLNLTINQPTAIQDQSVKEALRRLPKKQVQAALQAIVEAIEEKP